MDPRWIAGGAGREHHCKTKKRKLSYHPSLLKKNRQRYPLFLSGTTLCKSPIFQRLLHGFARTKSRVFTTVHIQLNIVEAYGVLRRPMLSTKNIGEQTGYIKRKAYICGHHRIRLTL
jgi:hypothetical protein